MSTDMAIASMGNPHQTAALAPKRRVWTSEDTANLNVHLQSLGHGWDLLPEGPVSRTLVAPRLEFASSSDARAKANEIVDGARTAVERLNLVRAATVDGDAAVARPRMAAKVNAAMDARAADATRLLRYYAETLSKNFLLSGPLVGEAKDGRVALNALAIGHAKFGPLLAVDATGRAIPPDGAARSGDRGSILDQVV